MIAVNTETGKIGFAFKNFFAIDRDRKDRVGKVKEIRQCYFGDAGFVPVFSEI